MPGMDGIQMLKALKAAKPELQVIMLSGREQAATIVEAVRLGAADYVVKPDDPEGLGEVALHSAIKEAIERNRLVSEISDLRRQLSDDQSEAFIGWSDSPAKRQVALIIEQVADSDVTVLIRGESGVGKELVARAIHQHSTRKHKPFVKVNWASGLDANGRPIQTPQPPGATTWPGQQGGTSWYSPSYSPRTGLFYIPAWEDVSGVFTSQPAQYQPGQNYWGGSYRATRPAPDAPVAPNIRRGPINNWTDAASHGAVVALDPQTGERKWTFRMYDLTDAGILTTASDLLFTGGREGFFQALDARTGELLWKSNLGSVQIYAAPITYSVEGKQYVSVIAGNVLIAYALRE
jgi:CheY-like chemotaxis protein